MLPLDKVKNLPLTRDWLENDHQEQDKRFSTDCESLLRLEHYKKKKSS